MAEAPTLQDASREAIARVRAMVGDEAQPVKVVLDAVDASTTCTMAEEMLDHAYRLASEEASANARWWAKGVGGALCYCRSGDVVAPGNGPDMARAHIRETDADPYADGWRFGVAVYEALWL